MNPPSHEDPLKSDNPIFELRKVSVSFSDKPVFEDLSFSIAKGDKVVLRGPSGCGKSTVLKLLLGLARTTRGDIFIEGEKMTPDVIWKFRGKVAYADQKIDVTSGKVLNFINTIFDFKNTPKGIIPDSKKIDEALKRFDLSPDILEKNTDFLSGGELQRIVMVAITLPGRAIYLLDEPTAALDGKRKEQVADYFLNSSDTVIVASHDEVWNRPHHASIIEMNPLPFSDLKTEN